MCHHTDVVAEAAAVIAGGRQKKERSDLLLKGASTIFSDIPDFYEL